MSTFHTSVLLAEVIEGLRPETGKKYIDATVGGAGHLIEIVRRGGIVLGIDADSDALTFAQNRVREMAKNEGLHEENVTLVHGNFRNIVQIAKKHGFNDVAGIVFDLGVSSFQLDTPQKGFGYRFSDAPLDLRLDQTIGETASDLVAKATPEQLYEIFTRFGEEELAHALSRAIISARSVAPITKAADLVRVVETVQKGQFERQKMLSRIFQALRIAVNDELTAIREGLSGAHVLLVPGGKVAVIAFHSLEDRIVKRFFSTSQWKIATKKPIIATDGELERNRRARSAKLRIAEKV